MKRLNLSDRNTKKVLWSYVFITPQLVLYLALTILPLFAAVPLLFTDRLNYTDVDYDYIGMENFNTVFTDDQLQDTFLGALGRTIRFSVGNYIMVFLFGLTMALLMYEIGFHSGIFTIIFLPYMLSGLALGFMAVMLFSESTGTANLILQKLGILADPINIKEESGTTIILPFLVGWRMAGFYMAIFLSGLLSIPNETIESSIVDGANYVQRLINIYFPQMIPSFIIATIFALVNSFNTFDELVALGGLFQNKAAEFLSIVIFNYGFSGGRLALGLTLAVITFIPLMLFSIILQYVQRRLQAYRG